jgi:hypothetical protein
MTENEGWFKMRIIRKKFGLLAMAAVVTLMFGAPVQAERGPQGSRPDETQVSVSAFPLYQFDTDLEGGGHYSVERYFFRFDAKRPMGDDLRAGVGILYDYEKWDFTGASGFRGIPWGEIHRTGVDLSFQYTGIRDWTLSLLPAVQSARESGADWGDSFQTGAVAAAAYRFSPTLTLGAGAGLYTGLEDTRGFPFLLVRWQIADRLTLANPFRPGPTGPAGLELIYSVNRNWEVAGGSAWRSYRFRLDDKGPAPEGIGEVNLIPAWGRITWRLDGRWAFDLYAGYAFGGELKLEDRNGNEIGKVDQDAAPFGALAVSFRF